MNQQLQTILDIVQQNENLTVDEKTALLKAAKKADSDLTISDFKLGRTEKVKRTVEILLEETIEELEQKRKAVEAQNRTLEIETALEKVRSRTMAMQHSDELAETSLLLDSQVRALGIKTWGCAFNIYQEKDSNEWFGNEAGIMPMYTVPRKGIFKTYYENGQKGEEFIVKEFKGKACIDHYEFMSTLPVIGDVLKQLKERNGSYPTYQIDHVAYFKYGYLLFITIESVPEAHDIFKRFAQVFEQTYTRFLDLQKAEEQAREAQIELALERVRASAMAMHHSDELLDVIMEVFTQLENLGINPKVCALDILKDDSKDWNIWVGNDDNDYPEIVVVPYIDNPILNDYNKARKKQKALFVESHTKEVKDAFFKHAFKKSGLKVAPKERQKMIMASAGLARSSSFTKHIGIMMINYDNIAFTDEENDILIRLTKVFDQSYTRFLDLQKAEAQTREAQIEAALERVRSKTMAMHDSQDVGETVVSLFDELVKLGLNELDRCGIGIMHDNYIMEAWTASKTNKEKAKLAIGNLNMKLHPLLEGAYEAWKIKKESYQYILEGDDKINYFNIINNQPDYKAKRDISTLPQKVVLTDFSFNEGILYSFSSKELLPEIANVFKRFAKVFDQTYTRFLDLQKAEEQAREAQIEAALEKVRSRSLAMHKTIELKDIISLVFEKLRELDVTMDSTCILTFDQVAKGHTVWAANPDLFSVLSTYVPYHDNPINKAIYDLRENGEDFMDETWTFEEKNMEYEYFFEHTDWKHLPDDMKQMVFNFEGWGLTGPLLKHSATLLVSYSQKTYSEHEIEIIKRIGNVFEQAYIRFLDLQKAEAQAREAQIETALERVRSHTMGMQHSDELLDVASILFQQVKELGVPQWSCGFNIWDIGDLEFTWYAGSPDGTIAPTPSKIPLTEHPIFKQFDESRRRGDELLVYEKAGKEQSDHYQYMLSLPGTGDFLQSMLDAGHTFPSFQIDHLANFSHGNLIFITYEHFPEMHDIFRRFAKVFEQTYTRFLDLQKAEAQTKEAQIETALEKVRSRSMGMQKSEELHDVIQVIYNQLIQLEFNIDGAGFAIEFRESDDWNLWFADRINPIPSKIHVPYFDHPLSNAIIEAKKNNLKLLVINLTSEEKNILYEQMFKYVAVPQEVQNAIFNSPGYAMSKVFFENVDLFIYNFTGFLYTDEENATLLKFGKVFEQTYTRFKDLKKAEAQAREAEIETALERVRSRTMGMQKSEELSAVIQVVYEQLIELNFDIDGAGFAVDHRESDDWNVWQTDGFVPHPYQLHMPYFDHPMPNAIIKAKKDGLELLVLSLTFEEKNKLIDEFFKYITQPKEVKKALYSFPGYVMSKVLLKNVDLYVSRYSGIPFTNAENAILIRFTKVFEQTYTRFNDLKQAEEQAYEARIEASLERIRSRSMAMQDSSELNEILATVFEELLKLNIELERSIIWIFNPEDQSVRWWHYNPEEKSGTESYLIPYLDHEVYHYHWKAWEERRNRDLYVLEGKNKETWDDIIFSESELSRTPKDVKKSMREVNPAYLNNTFHDFGMLMIGTREPLSEDKFSIIERFGRVFDQSYTRFKDVQKAEIRAKEVLKQSSLDRLRAKIASMRTATDLEQIIPSIWNELDNLGVLFIRCGVFIMNEESQSINTFLSAPNGKALAAFELAYDTNEIATNAVLNWKKKQIYQTSWNKKEFLAFMAGLIDKGLIEDPTAYQGAEQPPEHLYLNFAPFKQGMIYVGNVEPLTTEELDLVQSIAKAFSIAYARYEDFNLLEKAKKSVDDSLTELKATQAQLIQSEKMASLGELTAGIAHEIQNPLNFVNNFSEVSNELIDEMKEEIDNGNYEDVKEIADDVKLNLEKINHHGKRADAIVKGMLQHSRSGSTSKELTDINKLADEYLRLAYHGLRAKDKSFNATLNTDFEEAVGSINVLPQDIGRVILNLITNAFYTVHKKKMSNPENYEPTVTVKTKKSGNNIEVQVTDNGNGIPDHVLEKVFQPFFTTKPTGEGTGLGLSLSYDIVKAHNGELKVKTKEGEGTTFSMKLPTS